jgi:homoserine kinase
MAITSGASGDIFTQREKERTDWAVAQAMLQVADEFGIKGKLVVTQASYEGAKVVKADPPFSTGDITFKDNI